VTERFNLRSEPHWYPCVPRMSRLQALLVRLTGAHDWRRRLGRKGKNCEERNEE
jgi:hypothetical protein